jgi:hypothetical protein
VCLDDHRAPDRATTNALGCFNESRVKAPHEANLKQNLSRLCCRDHLIALLQSESHWFFAEDVFACSRGLYCNVSVGKSRSSYDHRIESTSRESFLQGGELPRHVELTSKSLARFENRVNDSDQRGLFDTLTKIAGVHPTSPPGTDQADPDWHRILQRSIKAGG